MFLTNHKYEKAIFEDESAQLIAERVIRDPPYIETIYTPSHRFLTDHRRSGMRRSPASCSTTNSSFIYLSGSPHIDLEPWTHPMEPSVTLRQRNGEFSLAGKKKECILRTAKRLRRSFFRYGITSCLEILDGKIFSGRLKCIG